MKKEYIRPEVEILDLYIEEDIMVSGVPGTSDYMGEEGDEWE